jgi:tripartite-type tricarboxylate transporter receptor subunit TctC
VNAVVIPNLGYDPVKDFTPLLGYARNMNVVLVPNDSRFKTFTDFLAQARTASDPLSVGTFSTTLNLSAAWLAGLANVKFNNIPYKGQAQVMTDVIGNQLDFALVDLGGATALIREKKLRALAVTGETRSPDFPLVPTVKESGLNDYVQYSWNALFVRSDVPPAIRTRLAEVIRTVMTSPETIENLHRPRGTEARPLTSEQMQKLQLEEIDRFRKIAKTIDFAGR